MRATNKGAFTKLSRIRLKEAHTLYDNGLYPGAFYLAGYSIECALKAKIAIILREYFKTKDFPEANILSDTYIHNLPKLLSKAQLEQKFNDASEENPQLSINWSFITGRDGWNEEQRYNESITEADTTKLFEAIEDKDNGILVWILKN